MPKSSQQIIGSCRQGNVRRLQEDIEALRENAGSSVVDKLFEDLADTIRKGEIKPSAFREIQFCAFGHSTSSDQVISAAVGELLQTTARERGLEELYNLVFILAIPTLDQEILVVDLLRATSTSEVKEILQGMSLRPLKEDLEARLGKLRDIILQQSWALPEEGRPVLYQIGPVFEGNALIEEAFLKVSDRRA